MATVVTPNEQGFYVVQKNARQIKYTNGTTRTVEQGEMVVVADGNSNCFIGVVATPGGIAAAATGEVDLCEGDVIMTAQVADSQTFTAKNTGIYFSAQTSSAAGSLYAASATGYYLLNALIDEVASDNSWVKLRMPPQTGTIVAVS